MPIAPTYPGVYIEEIPSGVHTITGVSTSITAFIGYTQRGRVNQPVHIFSFADFERAFGGLSSDSPLSHCVKHFFQNGGSEAYVVRAASNARTAQVSILNATVGGTAVLDVMAAGSGTWGNNLRIDVDYATSNPGSTFNLRVTAYVERDGSLVPGAQELHRNLSMNSDDPNFVERIANSRSQLIEVTRRPIAANVFGTGESRSGDLTDAALDLLYIAADRLSRNRAAFVLDGGQRMEFDLFTAASPLSPANVTRNARLDEIAGRLQAGIVGLTTAGSVTVTHPAGESFLLATSQTAGEGSTIRFENASRNDAAEVLRLTSTAGATETDASAQFRPALTGTNAVVPAGAIAGLGADAAIQIAVFRGADAAALNAAPILLRLWGAGTNVAAPPTTIEGVVTAMRQALRRSTDPLLAEANASFENGRLRLVPGPGEPNHWFQISNAGPDTTAADLGFTAADIENLARYAPGVGVARFAQSNAQFGNNGTVPGPADLRGSEADKTGIYALEDVDIFNLLVMPDATEPRAMMDVLQESIAYCVRRRAFMIIDAPEDVVSFAQAQAWITGDASPLRSRNVALYFPRLRMPNPLRGGVVDNFAAAGALAGLYARTDAERGVWKAPAGTSAGLVGATGLSYTLTDNENGTLNPQGLNCLRTFPVYGTVAWGARTARGADALTDEYKYIPVRRLALYLEESLFRGTKWVVFEPNDEPLWAQIRLNLGAFMHTLFAQGAFQGKTQREAYFVKCDHETTTQNDIDLGRVNIVVGFAPLKPAEFVIIQIQQIVRGLQT